MEYLCLLAKSGHRLFPAKILFLIKEVEALAIDMNFSTSIAIIQDAVTEEVSFDPCILQEKPNFISSVVYNTNIPEAETNTFQFFESGYSW